MLEIFPVAIVLPLLYLTARRFPLTPLLYGLIGVHCLILIVGAHYTLRARAARLLGPGRARPCAQSL